MRENVFYARFIMGASDKNVCFLDSMFYADWFPNASTVCKSNTGSL